MLEATLLFGGMGLHDQHSDLRLDVDNMSYEVRLLIASFAISCHLAGFVSNWKERSHVGRELEIISVHPSTCSFG